MVDVDNNDEHMAMAAIEEVADCMENFDESTMDSFDDAYLNELAIDNSADLNRYPMHIRRNRLLELLNVGYPVLRSNRVATHFLNSW